MRRRRCYFFRHAAADAAAATIRHMMLITISLRRQFDMLPIFRLRCLPIYHYA